jgi:hypothetical protein
MSGAPPLTTAQLALKDDLIRALGYAEMLVSIALTRVSWVSTRMLCAVTFAVPFRLAFGGASQEHPQ